MTYTVTYNHTGPSQHATMRDAKHAIREEAIRVRARHDADKDVVFLACEEATYAYLDEEQRQQLDGTAESFASISRDEE